ncbi:MULTISPECIES: hypothetical protein [Pseudomonas]|uniref:Peptidase C58 YopT-type domain-containing protein n=1 Tax=Pseudomonas synxantha TaxID=47883 RepID=A0A5D3GBL9_9PSED|nr:MULTISPECIES: hypothetical protein [Pseudomonas]MCK3852576.1 hypothetical protein [Pseudomonas sp. W2Jun17]TYK57939.1 hypothetical protein FXO26_11825 [Pseudomonas synxantha]
MLNIERRALSSVSSAIPFPEETQAPDTPQTQSTLSSPPARTSLIPSRKTGLVAQLADKENLKSLGQKLQQIAAKLGEEAQPSAVLAALGSTPLDIHPGSSYAEEAGGSVTLETFIKKFLGLPLPSSHVQLTGLASTVTSRSLENPLGNLSGALSWPVPLSKDEQQRLRNITLNQEHALGDKPLLMQTKGGVLEFLRYQQPITTGPQDDPAKILLALIRTPQAQLMGKDLQERMQGLASDSSVTDYLLAGITLQLDPESITAPHRNKIAGFDLASNQHWGKPASTIIDNLSNWLIDKGKTSPEMAKVGAYLLLAGRAPEYLIKDIPSSVKVGSALWAQLTIAAAKIEAHTPGRVPGMTYAEVLIAAESLPANTYAVQTAQRDALILWGGARNLLDRHNSEPTPSQIEQVRVAYNNHLKTLTDISSSIQVPIPNRTEMALDCLKAEFPDVDPAVFEARVLAMRYTGDGPLRGDPRMRSMLDILLEGERLGEKYAWITNDKRLPITAFNRFARTEECDITANFMDQYEKAITAQKKGHHGMVKHLIGELPLEDRKNFEFGKLEYFYNDEYRKTKNGRLELVKRDRTLYVKTTREGVETLYHINTSTGSIEKKNELISNFPGLLPLEKTNKAGEQLHAISRPYHPFTNSPAPDSAEKPGSDAIPNSFDSSRTNAIASFYLEKMDLDRKELLNYAKSVTSFEHDRMGDSQVGEFLLNLIPFRPAVNNIRQGNYGEAVSDLAFDILGFLTFGVGKAAQAGNAALKGVRTLSAGARAVKTAKLFGAMAIDSLNVLGGLVGGITGVGTVLHKIATKGLECVNMLKGATGSYDLLKAASKQEGIVATGTYKVTEQTVEGGAVFREGKWYAYDPITQKPYGAALDDFTPATVAANGQINSNFIDWIARYAAPNPSTSREIFRDTLESAQRNDSVAYMRGFNSGRVEDVPGYHPTMKQSEVRDLAVTKTNDPEAVGTLAKEIQKRMAHTSLEHYKAFQNEIVAQGGKAYAMPQNLYLSQTDLASNGECAAIVNTMALAILHGRRDQFISNFMKAVGNADDPNVKAFRKQLNQMHQVLSSQYHGTQPFSQLPYTDIIDNLSKATPPTLLAISTKDHGLLAGVTLNKNNEKEWFFFNPNFGLATFADEASMRRGLEVSLNSGWAAGTLKPVDVASGVPEFNVSYFNEQSFVNTVPYNEPYPLITANL